MKSLSLYETNCFGEKAFRRLLVHECPCSESSVNLRAGEELPVHSHDTEGQLSLVIIEGERESLGEDGAVLPANGDVLMSEICEPHGVRAKTDFRLLETISPPILEN
jgi:quercetin dioxygenase-like cupin family protein